MAQPSYQTDRPTDAYSTTGAGPAPKAGLSDKQKKMMGITAAALLLGGGVGLVLARPKKTETTDPVNPGTSGEATPTNVLPSDIDAAGKVTDQMTFQQAFRAAREEVGVGGVFNWHGRWYNTFEKEEWDSLSLGQRQEYVEMLTGEKLPIKPYQEPTVNPLGGQVSQVQSSEPTLIEGYLNGQRIIGVDVDHDGTIDALVLDGADGYTYRVIDESGNDGLDTLFRYDPLNGELMEIEKIDEPFILTNEQFSQGLEASMSKEVVDSVLESDVPATTVPATTNETELSDEPMLANSAEATYPPDEDLTYLAGPAEPDDTYINNGDVRDMDQ